MAKRPRNTPPTDAHRRPLRDSEKDLRDGKKAGAKIPTDPIVDRDGPLPRPDREIAKKPPRTEQRKPQKNERPGRMTRPKTDPKPDADPRPKVEPKPGVLTQGGTTKLENWGFKPEILGALRPEILKPFPGVSTPKNDVERLSDALPLTLLPVRLETLFTGTPNPTHLRIRIYPDQIHVNGHDTELSPDEIKIGQRFWTLMKEAGGDPDT